MYKHWIRPLFFRMNAESIHHFTINSLHAAGQFPGGTKLIRSLFKGVSHPELDMNIWGMNFPSPVGLAAGLDKNAEAVRSFSAMGFGFMEVGTVTPKPQAGNDRPRLFRLPEDQALVNRMGFNNVGMDRMAHNLRQIQQYDIPVAVNIGKNKSTPNHQAEDDYRECIRHLYAYGDFFVVNISSPNTPDLRNLQHGDDLSRLLAAAVQEMTNQKAIHRDNGKPILVKIAPDVSGDELDHMVRVAAASGISGIIATNTTIKREGLKHRHAAETGGLSGAPLRERSTEVVRRIYQLTEGKLPIIGSGGIFTAQDAYNKIKAGASLVEIYTSLIYEGPGLPRKINRGLLELLRKDGYSHISQAIGVEC